MSNSFGGLEHQVVYPFSSRGVGGSLQSKNSSTHPENEGLGTLFFFLCFFLNNFLLQGGPFSGAMFIFGMYHFAVENKRLIEGSFPTFLHPHALADIKKIRS